jgi:Putative zinc-finger
MTQPTHCGQIEAAFPWYLNGTASADDSAMVEKHVAGCASCERRLASERQLFQQIAFSATEPNMDADVAWGQFASTLGDASAPLASPRAEPVAAPRYLRHLAIAQAAALAFLAMAVVYILSDRARLEPNFRTVTTPATVARHGGLVLRIAVAPDISTPQFLNLARAHGATVLAGPTPQGVFTLELPTLALQELALERLRATPGMLLVEPVSQPIGH